MTRSMMLKFAKHLRGADRASFVLEILRVRGVGDYWVLTRRSKGTGELAGLFVWGSAAWLGAELGKDGNYSVAVFVRPAGVLSSASVSWLDLVELLSHV